MTTHSVVLGQTHTRGCTLSYMRLCPREAEKGNEVQADIAVWTCTEGTDRLEHELWSRYTPLDLPNAPEVKVH